MTRLKIALLAGGDSPEREIALQSAALIEAALDHSKYDITVIDLHGRDWHHTAPDGRQWQVDTNDFSITVDGVRKAFDYALIIIHGTPGEDGKLQGYLDMMGVPYSSCSMTSSVITFDKITAKRTLAGRVNLAREVFLRRGEAFDPAQIVAELGMPLFVKPNANGSSFGVTKVHAPEELPTAIEAAFAQGDEILIEECVAGREMGCGMLVAGGEVVKTAKTDVVIDGLDKTTAATLIPDRGSVTGGDGTYSIPLPDGRSIFLMGDSYIGPVTNGQRPTSDHMFRNTYILYDEGRVSAIYGAGGDRNASAAVPPGVSDESRKWYWPGHGFVEGNTLYVFQTVMYQGAEGMWGFRYETTDILEYELPSLTLRRTTRIPFRGSEDIHYGMAALNDGDYVYVYAQVDVTNDADPISEVLVARTTPAKLCTDWEYYTGSGWSTDPSAAERLEGLASVPVSSQFNVFRLRDKYVLLTQNKRYNSGEIYTFTSDSPAGPWRNKQLIYRIPAMENRKLFTYNAMAHPQFEKDGMILVSYNVNTEEFSQQFSDVSTYRPRFFWIGIDRILNSKR